MYGVEGRRPVGRPRRTRLTRHTISGGDVTHCCANCVEPSRPQQWGPDLPFWGKTGHAYPLNGWRCSSHKRVMCLTHITVVLVIVKSRGILLIHSFLNTSFFRKRKYSNCCKWYICFHRLVIRFTSRYNLEMNLF